ncbi:hypothetical protein ASD15_20770 [Massilia sp. Root351]|nr:hypothetical protein ASD15_20770 [Massilia sp. Root351]
MLQKRAEIVEATIACLSRVGVLNTTLSDICEAAAISRGALYVHFESKDEILGAVVDQFSAAGLVRLQFDSAEALVAVLERHVGMLTSAEFRMASRIELELILASSTSAGLKAKLENAAKDRYNQFYEGLKNLRKQGATCPDIDLHGAATAIDAYLSGVILTHAMGGARPAKEHLKALALILNAVVSNKG